MVVALFLSPSPSNIPKNPKGGTDINVRDPVLSHSRQHTVEDNQIDIAFYLSPNGVKQKIIITIGHIESHYIASNYSGDGSGKKKRLMLNPCVRYTNQLFNVHSD